MHVQFPFHPTCLPALSMQLGIHTSPTAAIPPPDMQETRHVLAQAVRLKKTNRSLLSLNTGSPRIAPAVPDVSIRSLSPKGTLTTRRQGRLRRRATSSDTPTSSLCLYLLRPSAGLPGLCTKFTSVSVWRGRGDLKEAPALLRALRRFGVMPGTWRNSTERSRRGWAATVAARRSASPPTCSARSPRGTSRETVTAPPSSAVA
mmetsp:Transcript_56177/g.110000  ORF Transcript_56177/g.110000 Transcript_56177/m.110000 type:complete len:203 (+) Transcript_56177:112-720(+)